MPTSFINVGAAANDNSGNNIRSAFQTVNSNFDIINQALFSGITKTNINADTVSADNLSSGVFTASSAVINGNVQINGALTVTGTQTSTGGSSATSTPIQYLHNGTLTANDGFDIGTVWYHYKTANLSAFLGWQNSSNSLVYMDTVTLGDSVVSAGTFGNVQFGSLLLSRTTPSTSNVTGALQVAGGVGVQGNLYVQSNIFVGNNTSVGNLTVRGYHVGDLNFVGVDTVRINGSPVLTSAGGGFSGGPVLLSTQFQDTTATTRLGVGAVTVAGGLAANGNAYIGGNLVVANAGGTFGNIFGNIAGQVILSAQPYITSLGDLTSLTMLGTIAGQNISPRTNLTYTLGTNTNSRWLKIWAYDIDYSNTLNGVAAIFSGNVDAGNLSGATIVGTNGSFSGNIGVGSIAASGNITVTSNVTASNISITSNVQSVSTTTGALRVTGGVSIPTGNLYIGGSAGNAVVTVGDFYSRGNIFLTGTNPALRTNQPTVYLFPDTASTVIVGASTSGPSTQFKSNIQATSTTTGAIQVTGGLSIATGNLYIGGSGGNAVVFSGNLTGNDSPLRRVALQDTAWSWADNSTGTTIDYTNGSMQRWAPTAASSPTLTITNWPPAGQLGELLIEGVNLGAAGTITFPTASWIKIDGTFAASPSAAGINLQNSGIDFIFLWTRDGGTTIYAKVIR